jgi:hypothetical protein
MDILRDNVIVSSSADDKVVKAAAAAEEKLLERPKKLAFSVENILAGRLNHFNKRKFDHRLEEQALTKKAKIETSIGSITGKSMQSVIQYSGALSKTPQDIKIYKNARTPCNPLIVNFSLPFK